MQNVEAKPIKDNMLHVMLVASSATDRPYNGIFIKKCDPKNNFLLNDSQQNCGNPSDQQIQSDEYTCKPYVYCSSI